jgi:outer membrane protein assembly factor BamA
LPQQAAPKTTGAGRHPSHQNVRFGVTRRSLNAGTPAISVEVGNPLDHAQVAASLKALYRTGNYANIQAVSEPMDGGIRLDFVVEENLFFNQVILFGLKSPPSEASAAAAMQLTLGDVFRKETLNDALDRLKMRLQEEGLYSAKVDAELRPHPAEHQMDILVRVQPGPRARVGAIQLTNNTEYPDTEIASRLKMKPSSEITSSRIQNGTSRIRKFLIKKGHERSRRVRRSSIMLLKIRSTSAWTFPKARE